MTLHDDIAALRARIAARPHSGELLWDDYRRLALLARSRADAAVVGAAARAVDFMPPGQPEYRQLRDALAARRALDP